MLVAVLATETLARLDDLEAGRFGSVLAPRDIEMRPFEFVVVGEASQVVVRQADGQIERDRLAQVGRGMLIPLFHVPENAIAEADPLRKRALASVEAELVPAVQAVFPDPTALQHVPGGLDKPGFDGVGLRRPVESLNGGLHASLPFAARFFLEFLNLLRPPRHESQLQDASVRPKLVLAPIAEKLVFGEDGIDATRGTLHVESSAIHPEKPLHCLLLARRP